MASAKLYDLARMTVAAGGTGQITLGSAVAGFLSFTAAGATSGDLITYAIEDGNNREMGHGIYTISGNSAYLSRDTIFASTNSGAALTVSTDAQVFISIAAEDMLRKVMPPRIVQAATNAANGRSVGTCTLAKAPTPGNLLVGFVSGRMPDDWRTPFTQVGGYGVPFNSVKIGVCRVAAGAATTYSVSNWGDYINIAVFEVENCDSWAVDAGIPTGSPLTAGSGLTTSRPAIALSMIEIDNIRTQSGVAAGWTLQTYFGELDTHNHNAAMLYSGVFTSSQAAPSVTLSGSPTYPVYASLVLKGAMTLNVLGALTDVDLSVSPTDKALLSYDQASGSWKSVNLSDLKSELGFGRTFDVKPIQVSSATSVTSGVSTPLTLSTSFDGVDFTVHGQNITILQTGFYVVSITVNGSMSVSAAGNGVALTNIWVNGNQRGGPTDHLVVPGSTTSAVIGVSDVFFAPLTAGDVLQVGGTIACENYTHGEIGITGMVARLA